MADGEKIKISNVKKIQNRRFQVDSTEFDLNFNTNPSIENPDISRDAILRHHNECFAEMLNFVDRELNIQSRDLIGIKFHIPSIDNVVPFGMNFVERQELSTEMISDLLLMVQQSNSLFEDKDLVQITVTVIHRETGGARVPLKRLCSGNLEELIRVKKRSILTIPKEHFLNDKKCLARSLILAKVWNDSNGNKRKYQQLFHKNCEKLNKLTDKLIKMLSVLCEILNVIKVVRC